MTEIYKRLYQELSSGYPAIMASIIRQTGSSPRSLGSKFVVCHDGSLVGSIGGGKLEAQVIEAGNNLLGRDVALVMEIRMTGREAAGTDMICGGNIEVLVQGITPANARVYKVLGALLQLIDKKEQGILAMGPLPLSGQEDEMGILLFQPEAEPVGSIGEDKMVLDQISSSAKKILSSNMTSILSIGTGDRSMLLEPLYSRPTAIVFGGGHISLHLVSLLDNVDFRVVVVDDRFEFANRDRFPRADQVIASDFEECFKQMEFDPETYCVIVTRGHLHDKVVLENILPRTTGYVGMIGSRNKRDTIYKALMGQGFSLEQLEKVSSPIGLAIGAETPEEIALSVAAEMVGYRAEKERLSKGEKVKLPVLDPSEANRPG
ncbi:MAG: XdhC family protein [Deltaproteobacteria bacterium]|nr:XdhC family protein [Deltaproteobacteria bacterium]MBW1860948.1 XdhC family protein [Deltaproteobacteria bacterium]